MRACEQIPRKRSVISSELKQRLAKGALGVEVKIGSLTYHKMTASNLQAAIDWRGLQVEIDPVAVEAFGGALDGEATASIAGRVPEFKGRFMAKGVAMPDVAALVDERYRALVAGKGDVSMSFATRGRSLQMLLASLDAQGAFDLEKGAITTVDLTKSLEQKLQAFTKGLSPSKVGGSVASDIQNLMERPIVRGLARAKGIDSQKVLGQLEGVRELDFTRAFGSHGAANDIEGTFTIEHGALAFKTKRDLPSGAYDLRGRLHLATLGLDGALEWTASSSIKDNLLKQSRHAALLFDDKGQFKATLQLAGTVAQPKVELRDDALANVFEKNVLALIEKEMTRKLPDTQAGRELDKFKRRLGL